MREPTPPTETGVSIQDACVRFAEGSIALRGVNLEVAAGEIVSLIGPSGCGKSTLLRVIAGLQPLNAGSVAFHPQPLVPGQLGFVFQDPALIPWRTALANVRLPLDLLGRQSPEDATARSSSVLTEVGLAAADHKKYPAQLSGGMRMRVSIARALVSDPSVLLMDEPFAALDDLLRGRLLELLQSLWQRRKRTILFVTHNIAEALLLSQRVLVMNAGGVQGELSLPWPYPRPAELRGSAEFGDVYTQVSRHLAEAGNERPE